MPGKRCTVAVCNNSHSQTKEKGISYFSFPKDPEIRRKWVHLCRRDGKWNPDSCSICSEHFLPEDFERDLKSELLNIPCRKKLKPIAIPSQNLSKSTAVCNNETSSDGLKSNRNERYVCRENKQLVDSLLAPENISENSSLENQLFPPNNNETQTHQNEKIRELIEENNALKATLLRKNRILRNRSLKIRRLTNKDKRKRNRQAAVESKITEKLKTIFTQNQLDLLLGSKKIVRWTNEEISVALTLRYLGKRTYLYLKRKCHFPLPSLSTLNRWITNINVRKGFFGDIFRLMKTAGEKMDGHEKVAVLMYDEMKVKETYEYDQKFEQVIGPHKQMQVIVLRGIFSNWKQPIFLDFDTSITPEIVSTAIQKTQACGFDVVACVSDMGGGNYGMWKKLNVSVDKPWFENPSDPLKKVFMFPDAPHMLKLLRNWFLDTGFQLNDNIVVDKSPIVALLELDSNELKVCHKLSEKHVLCEGAERQNVRLAAQLFSHTVATALDHYKPGNDETGHLSQFIGIVNDWFDLMNTYVPKRSLQPLKCGYGLYEEEQTKCLEKMFESISVLRCKGKKKMLPFQKGILLSISATKGLLAYVKNEYKMSYILTHRLNQDGLENLFSQIRTRGGLNDHPTPLNAIHRLRMIIFGKNPGIVQSHLNTTEVSLSEFIVATVIKKLDLNTSTEEHMNQEEEVMEVDETVGFDVQLSDIEEGGQQYLAGWVAKKYLKKYPGLGKNTYKTSTDEPSSEDSWIRHLSKVRYSIFG